jgi:hypothetical protein
MQFILFYLFTVKFSSAYFDGKDYVQTQRATAENTGGFVERL